MNGGKELANSIHATVNQSFLDTYTHAHKGKGPLTAGVPDLYLI